MDKKEVKYCNICDHENFEEIASGYDYEYQTTLDHFQYVGCLNCNHIFLRNPPEVSELKNIYPQNYLPYKFETDLNVIVKYFRNFVQKLKVKFYKGIIKDSASILEIGSGSGILMESLRRYGNENWKLTANDFDGKRLNRLKEQNINIIVGNFEEIDFAQKFDIIILNQVIEHFYSPDGIINKCGSILFNKGYIIIETPNYDSFDFKIFKKSYWGGYHMPRHFHIYSPETIKKHLTKHHFKVEQINFLLSPSFWIQSFHHLLYARGNILHKLFVVNNIVLISFFSFLDLILSKTYKTSNMRIMARYYG